MHSFKSYLLIFAVYLYSSSLLYGQTPCGAAITPIGTDPVCYGTPLSATPTGPGFKYQWQRNGVNIIGATKPTQPVEADGDYSVIVSGTTCRLDTSDVVAVKLIEQEAKFNANEKERDTPQSPPPLCGVPVTYTLENESTGNNLTYQWEILDGNKQSVPVTTAEFVAPSNNTVENPVIRFYQKGQYTIRLKIIGECNPGGEDGPLDTLDIRNPNVERDGRYVHEEQVVVVYPQIQPQPLEFCLDPTAGPTVTLNGRQLIGEPDGNLGTIDPASFVWTVPNGVTISGNATSDNPTFQFPNVAGAYTLTVDFANECEKASGLRGEPTEITVTFNPLPDKPTIARPEVFVCEGETYTINPSPNPNNQNRLYNFYTAPTGGSPLNTGGPQPMFSVGPLTGRRVIYISAFENGCESADRTMFTINIIQQELKNEISTDQSICAETKPNTLTGSNATVGTATPIYLWESQTASGTFTAAAGTNDQQNYSPPVLQETTIYRRTVTFEGCSLPNFSNEVTVEVLPVIEPSENIIEVDKEVVCKGDVPTLTGNLLSGDIEYVWESSTTSATTGFIPAVGSDNTNGALFTPGFITQTTWYRRTAKYRNTNCDPVPSAEAIQVTIDELPATPVVVAAAVSTCQGGSATLEVVPDATGNGTLTYNWYIGEADGTQTLIGSGTPFVTPALTQNTTFYVEAENENECVSLRRTSVMVTVLPITANAGRDTTIIEGQSTTLRGTGAPGATYSWSPVTGLSNPNVANPVATPTETTIYTLTVTNGDLECVATDEVTVTVIPRIKIVNTFSPNNDGVNEVWEIENIQNYPEATVEIFNRYGAQVFKSNIGYTQPWNGTHNGNPLPLATYYYIIHLNKNEKPFTGSITIIK
ncbi:gliding motility-associated C-terminal domain-containing protein [Rufibacter sp. XAAS-G3-1]|uniref:gliding motility-associated C-terminal domain-containing protein n=1 Tax=Rufibacter sp. XAAS-G3-1 TaxID=2729134 RepID=UPI0015E6EB34|nr:gliding motility-associated C-terminal domain-containing protein [Rufibacter sp. XAAS-G3-1]